MTRRLSVVEAHREVLGFLDYNEGRTCEEIALALDMTEYDVLCVLTQALASGEVQGSDVAPTRWRTV